MAEGHGHRFDEEFKRGQVRMVKSGEHSAEQLSQLEGSRLAATAPSNQHC